MNLNQLARTLTLLEGKRKQISIAQVKEILFHLGSIMSNEEDEGKDLRKKLIAAARKRKSQRELQAKKFRARTFA